MNYLKKINTGIYKIKDKIFLKCEWQSITGTPKARFVSYRINRLENEGLIKKGMNLYDVSTGSEAVALAQFGVMKGYKVEVWLPDYCNKNFIEYVKRFGAKVNFVNGNNWLKEGAAKAREAAEKDKNGFYFNQADSLEDATKAYSSLGEEFASVLKEKGVIPDALVSVVGSGGLLFGTAIGMKKIFPSIKVYAIELDTATYLYSSFYKKELKLNSHHVWGISSEGSTRMKEELLKLIEGVILINEKEMKVYTKKVPREEGISIDYPTASNILGAEKLLKKDFKSIATIWTGHGWRTL